MNKSKMIGISLLSLLAIGLLLAINYVALPAWNFRSPGLWWFLILVLAIVSTIITIACFDEHEKPIELSWIISAVVLVVFLVLGIASWNVFHAHELHDIANVTVSNEGISDFADIAAAENLETLPLVDLDTAITLGDKKIASIEHASWYDMNTEYNLIKFQGKYYRLSTIDYAGFLKYNKAKYDGVPGYVLVSVTPNNGVVTQDATLVVLDTPIRYTPGAFWSYDLRRHLRNQYPSYMFDRSFMEIDESGVPYWVTGVKRPTTGMFGGKVVTSFILTNAQTGESKEYPIDDAPNWIDHIYSLGYLMQTAYWHYGYADGYWNNSFSKTNVWRTSYEFRDNHKTDGDDGGAEKFANFYGYSSIVSSSGEVCFYTGLTAANNAESNLGWLVIDTSTGKMTQYNLVGAEESSAQAAVEQLVQEKGYEATFPLPVNIGGEASYLMCLKGKAGLVQSYGICNMDNYSIAVQADTLNEAIRKYQIKLGGDVSEEVFEGETTEVMQPTGEIQSGSGKISAIYTAEINGTTQFYYTINGDLYRSAITVNEHQVLYKTGTEISFDYYEDGDIRVIIAIK